MPYFNVAGLKFYIESEELNTPYFYNYHPFKIEEEDDASLLFRMRYQALPPMQEMPAVCFQMDRGVCRIWLEKDGYEVEFQLAGRQRIYRMRADRKWSSVEVDIDFSSVHDYSIMNDCIMVAFVYSAAFYDAVLMHASCVKCGGQGVAFVGPSGVGKSTHSLLWLEHIMGTVILNDDQPVVRLMNGVPYLFGTPWSGKTVCYKNEYARLSALFLMEQAKENQVERLTPRHAFMQLLSSCAMIKEDENTFARITQTIAGIANAVKAFHLQSKPEKEAAELSFLYGIENKAV